MKLKNTILNFLYNSTGWKTKRKLIVIASDDWGGIRVASAKASAKLTAAGITMDSNRFNKFDVLESNDDMELLLEVLSKHKDFKGNNAVMTALTNVANPDFEKIREAGFSDFYYERFIETLKHYPNHDNVYNLYRSGIANGIFIPEFHGREHVNIRRWMHALQQGHIKSKLGFDHQFFMMDSKDLLPEIKKSFGPAFDVDSPDEIESHKRIITDGLNIFHELFGYKATLFTAPSLLYNNGLDQTLSENGIALIDVKKYNKMPMGNGQSKSAFFPFGKTNNTGQRYIQRNAVFEPNLYETNDTVDSCLSEIAAAFRHNKPAIISNHRVCFSGGIDLKNRDKSLSALDSLLRQILEKWPDAEFIPASQLQTIMNR
ncbi:polysaccharide (de)acetylase [Flavobacterium sp.]|uniref:polysaccharide (de)acetylase n=1 Tax=Flavobacterium sp. TaxID=239 RepID=UPI0026332F09|nr:polysaccharide (de)acetylase [Flavobacterium sp.]